MYIEKGGHLTMKNKGDVATESVHFRISKTTHFKLQQMADEDNRPLSGYIRNILEKHAEDTNAKDAKNER
jgi:predicted DNA-binding protein